MIEEQKIIDLKEIRKKVINSAEVKELLAVTKKAKKILGEKYVLGPDDLEKYFGIPLTIVDARIMKTLPFSSLDLKAARKRGEMLIFRVPILEVHNGFFYATIKNFKERFPAFLFKQNWYKNEYFFEREVSSFGWCLVKKEPLLESFGKTYQEQEEILQKYIVANRLPHWKTGRRKAVEIVYDTILYYLKNNERLLNFHYEWALSPENINLYKVRLGRFNQKGLRFYRYQKNTQFKDKFTGLCPSRLGKVWP